MTARHVAIADGPSLDGTYSWFCQLTVKGSCDGEGFGYETPAASIAAAVATGHEVATDDEYPGRFDGIPGLVWYAKVVKTFGRDLKLGDWLDSLDHRGARMIVGMYLGVVPDQEDGDEDWVPGLDVDPNLRTVIFTGGDGEVVRVDVAYDVVDPDSQVAPDGSPLGSGPVSS